MFRTGGLLVASMFMFLTVYRYVDLKPPVEKPYITASVVTPNTTTTTLPLEWLQITLPDFMNEARNTQEAMSGDDITTISGLFVEQNVSQESLLTWNHLESLVDNAQSLINGVDAIKEAGIVWESLLFAVEAKKLADDANENQTREGEEELCPQFLSKMNATEADGTSLKLKIPCGLTQGSSVIVIGIPDGLLGSFRIDLTGQPLPGELSLNV